MFFPPTKKVNVVTAAEQTTQTMDAESDAARSALQNLDYPTWLPFAAKTYKISPNIDDYVLAVFPICPSDTPNRNGIGFPLSELTRFQPPPISRMAYKAWTGCPVHYEHRNEIHEDAYGVILDTSLHKIKGYGNGKLWKVMGLIAIDKTKYPEMAQRVLDGDIDTGSMGAYVDTFSCSYCNAPMTKTHFCNHVHPSNDIDWKELKDYDGSTHIAFRNAHGLSPLEYSLVESPAWVSSLSDHILTR
jgi:hypothetical protein